MELTDTELIQNTLSGDQNAFAALVRRYQKQVHALAWRNTGDFHVAEEITQDTFLRAYGKLGSLKNPKLLAGWLYVIANRLCKTWLSKKGHEMQSLETVPTEEIEQHTYSDWTEKQREEHATDRRVEIVKQLLQKLPESERIVITLHYLADSSVKEISEFLGVSLNTVKSRLHRARKRLQKEEHMLKETLGSYQPSTNLTDNIMRNIKQTGTQIDSPTSKPFIPILSAASTLILVVLMLGIGSQHLARFQKPYSLDAPSKMSVEIVDEAVLMNLPSDPNVRNQIGNVNATNKSEGTNHDLNSKLSSANSGRVVDEKGNPISGIKIALTPVENKSGGWFPVIPNDENGNPIDKSFYQAETNIEGHFTVTNTLGGPVHLSLFPERRSGYEILKVQMAGMYFFPTDFPSGRGVVFAISPDAHHEDIEVVLKQPQMRIKVLRSDGTALTNTKIRCDIKIESRYGYSTSELAVETDENGYFVYYMDESGKEDVNYTCSMTATYENQKASLSPFEFKSTGYTHDAVLIFGEQQMQIFQPLKDSITNSPSQISTGIQNDSSPMSIVAEQTATLSGRVVDVEGKAIADLHVFLQSVNTSDLVHVSKILSPRDLLKSQHSKTNTEGAFTIKNIPSGATYLGILPNSFNAFLPKDLAKKISGTLDRKDINTLRSMGFFERDQDDFEPDYEVLSISKKGIIIYPHSDSDPIIFDINPATHSKNIVVTVRQRMRIRGRLLYEDRTPVVNIRINLRESRYTEDGKGFGSSGGNPKTDANGYFIYYPEEEHDPRYYVFGLRYKDMVAESEPIRLKPGERFEELTLILKSIP